MRVTPYLPLHPATHRWLMLLLSLTVVLAACSPTRKARQSAFRPEFIFDTSRVFQQSLSGFFLSDPASGRVLASYNADHYFTPASNTKILTLAVGLNVLGPNLPGIEYQENKDTFWFRGTGDPTLLHPGFEVWQQTVPYLSIASRDKVLVYCETAPELKRFGPGWCWDDFTDYYQTERSALPIYGNTAWFYKTDSSSLAQVIPDYFEVNLSISRADFRRDEAMNIFYNPEIKVGDSRVPFRRTAILPLLIDTLHRNVEIAGSYKPQGNWAPIFTTPTDTVLRKMMLESDNFLAEQLLLQAAWEKTGIFDADTIISWAKNQFPYSSTPPRWVDGSGLSRYNLITPAYLGAVLTDLYQKMPREKLFPYFPAGGTEGTIKDWYRNPNGSPFVYAKTGSMSGVICLSGYVLTKSGKTLVFSIMNNNFVGSNKPWREEMGKLLLGIHNHY